MTASAVTMSPVQRMARRMRHQLRHEPSADLYKIVFNSLFVERSKKPVNVNVIWLGALKAKANRLYFFFGFIRKHCVMATKRKRERKRSRGCLLLCFTNVPVHKRQLQGKGGWSKYTPPQRADKEFDQNCYIWCTVRHSNKNAKRHSKASSRMVGKQKKTYEHIWAIPNHKRFPSYESAWRQTRASKEWRRDMHAKQRQRQQTCMMMDLAVLVLVVEDCPL